MRVIAFVLWGSGLVHAAINLDGSWAVAPVTEDDPSPISDPSTYYPALHDCPLPCVDYSNIHSWIPYFSVDRLRRCEDPMLLKFSVTQSLNDSSSTVLIRSCTLGHQQNDTSARTTHISVENPKKSKNLFQPTLQYAPACAAAGTEVSAKVELAASTEGWEDADGAVSLLRGMGRFFDAEDNCDENFLFGYHQKTVVGIYVGAHIGKPTITSSLAALGDHLGTQGTLSNRTVAQLCSDDREPERVFGIFVDTTGDLAAAQETAWEWSHGSCVTDPELRPAGDLPGVKILEISSVTKTFGRHSTLSGNSTSTRNSTSVFTGLNKRDTCSYIQVESGDGCWSVSQRCGISTADLEDYNPKEDFCDTLQPGDYVCCSAGDPYEEPKPDPPKENPDGTCASHLIQEGNTCDVLATQYGVTVQDLEDWNEGKTWGWTDCKGAMLGYKMCVSSGNPPLPAPQAGSQCGPLVPGTELPTDPDVSIAELNPCPLKSCCSNWGYCGVFPGHCTINAPEGGGPGSKLPDAESTCISNCGTEIKQNSGPPDSFQRIGYYEAYNLNRECLWMKAKNANPDGAYTHLHWGFLGIDPETWKPILMDGKDEWADFKALAGVRRIVSFGGWAYSTEAATYNIIRQAIIDNAESFATNLAQFVEDEGIDGVDIDWEYPGAPDIYVGDETIGQKTDGKAYLDFLTVLRQKMPEDKSVSIAAPASYWYLQAFPIDQIAEVIDYIVYMTYDLHGQWDYGQANSFDECDSGKCIRSHVNLTETQSALAMVTKAGVPNNKVFVGEASYGRSFHMAQDGCWEPMCEFTGSRTESDATPGRCTSTGGYLAYAEITEILVKGDNVQQFHDSASNTDIMLYKGDYVSYMTPTTKETRRSDWSALNFAGTIDWAVDLQQFTRDDIDIPPDRPDSGEACVGGADMTVNTGDLCEFACLFGFCPETLCTCRIWGPVESLPPEKSGADDIIAWDEHDADINRLCKFACKYGYCPDDICTTPDVYEDFFEDDDHFDYEAARRENQAGCLVFKNPDYRDESVKQCSPICKSAVDDAKAEGRTTNYGCVGFYAGQDEIPWYRLGGGDFYVAKGQCVCDDWLINELADTFVEVLPAIAQIGCYLLMSSLKFVIDLGAQFIPVVGKPLDAGLDMATTAAQMAKYVYPDEENPEDAFSWWLSPCGGSELVPEEMKKAFEVLSVVADGVSSFKKPKNVEKGSGKKGDNGNPTDRSRARPGGGKSGPGGGTSKKCRVPASQATQRLGHAKNTVRRRSCVAVETKTEDLIISSLAYAANAAPTSIFGECKAHWSQACYHYSSVISNRPEWATLTCPPEAATVTHRQKGFATNTWYAEHEGAGWREPHNRAVQLCDRDEWPPAYLLQERDPAILFGGEDTRGQMVRLLPASENRGAGQMWKSICLSGALRGMSDRDIIDSLAKAPSSDKTNAQPSTNHNQVVGKIGTDIRPQFTINKWSQTSVFKDGHLDNKCWPSAIAPKDPGFPLLQIDPYYYGKSPVDYNYKADYEKGVNGV